MLMFGKQGWDPTYWEHLNQSHCPVFYNHAALFLNIPGHFSVTLDIIQI